MSEMSVALNLFVSTVRFGYSEGSRAFLQVDLRRMGGHGSPRIVMWIIQLTDQLLLLASDLIKRFHGQKQSAHVSRHALDILFTLCGNLVQKKKKKKK